MNKYKKPKCECGAFLKAVRSEYWRVTRNITKDGEISKNVIKMHTGFDESDYEIRLICTKCGARTKAIMITKND